ncbi:MAG: hypothetical protein IJV54_09595, partial [Bacteroidales bacterium]|nr:hypothetical protein [Bacteroidales bacterium]
MLYQLSYFRICIANIEIILIPRIFRWKNISPHQFSPRTEATAFGISSPRIPLRKISPSGEKRMTSGIPV